MTGSELDGLLEQAIAWASEAGQATLPHFRGGVTAEWKGDNSPVTVADREAERLLRTRIGDAFPSDGILGEEFGEWRPGAVRRWILDPIDGTRSFVHGVPLFGVLVALEADREIVLGVLHFPALGETVAAARGRGSWFNGVRAAVSPVSRIDEALVLTTSGAPPEADRRPGWDALASAAREVRTWGDAYGHALVATGRAEVMVDFRLAPWDVAALVPVVEESGGVLTDFAGRRGHRVTSGISTNAGVAGEARRLLGVAHPPRDGAGSPGTNG